MVNGSLALDNQQNDLQLVGIANKPVKHCSVTISDVIARGKRLEASVFDIEAKQARETITNGKYPCVPLSGENGLIDTAYYPGRFKRIYCDKNNGEAFYLPSQMTNIYPKPDKFISRLTKCDFSALRLKPNTLLLTRSGTIGNISLSSKTIEGKLFSDDVIRITFKQIMDLGYCYSYLKSKLGNVVLQTNGYGSVVTHLELEHLREIPIPNAPEHIKRKIHNLIMESYELRDKSNSLLDQAENMLINELHLPNISDFDVNLYQKNADVDTFSVKLSDIAGRVDASYHVPIVDAMVDHMHRFAKEVTTVGDPRISKDVILPDRFKRVYVDEGYGRILIGGKQLYELDPSEKKYLSNTKHNQLFNKLEIQENTTLITRSGTIGKVALVPKHWTHWIPSDHIIRVIPSDGDIAGYLNVFLASEYGHILITRFTYGSVVDEIDDTHVSRIPIPLLKNSKIQEAINELALGANKLRYEAYKLEQQALKIMDEEVIFAK